MFSCISSSTVRHDLPRDKRIFNYPDAGLTGFSTEISAIKNRWRQDGIGLGPASYHDHGHDLLTLTDQSQIV